MDLSLKRQLLDVVVVKRREQQPDLSGICDGFDNLSAHNLISYKSKRQSLNVWALEELIGHYVNYRKILGVDKVRAMTFICMRSAPVIRQNCWQIYRPNQSRRAFGNCR